MSEKRLYKRLGFYDIIIFETSFLCEEQHQPYLDDFIDSLHKFSPKHIILSEEIEKEIERLNSNQDIIVQAKRFLKQIKEHNRCQIAESDKKTESVAEMIFLQLDALHGKYHTLLLTADCRLANRLHQSKKVGQTEKNLHICRLVRQGSLEDFPMILHQLKQSQPFKYQPDMIARKIGKLIKTPIPALNDDIFIRKQRIKLKKCMFIGGEGTIYELDEQMLIKIYHDTELTDERISKLLLMLNKPINHPQIIWPQDVVENKLGVIVGFTMKRITGYGLDELFGGVREIKRIAPQWKRIDIINLSLSILKLIQFIHKSNILIGDIRPENFMFKSPLEVFILDTDSFQIEDYPSCKGDPFYTPPEMQNKLFNSNLRTFGNEHFGVASLLFKILMLGQNAYASTMKDTVELSITERITKMAFPYSTLNRDSSNNAPLGIWAYVWSHMPFYLKNAFIETFNITGTRNLEQTRYQTLDWIAFLEEYKRLLLKGYLFQQDAMSVELFPTRFKQPNLESVRFCSFCGKRSEKLSWKKDQCPICKKENAPIFPVH